MTAAAALAFAFRASLSKPCSPALPTPAQPATSFFIPSQPALVVAHHAEPFPSLSPFAGKPKSASFCSHTLNSWCFFSRFLLLSVSRSYIDGCLGTLLIRRTTAVCLVSFLLIRRQALRQWHPVLLVSRPHMHAFSVAIQLNGLHPMSGHRSRIQPERPTSDELTRSVATATRTRSSIIGTHKDTRHPHATSTTSRRTPFSEARRRSYLVHVT